MEKIQVIPAIAEEMSWSSELVTASMEASTTQVMNRMYPPRLKSSLLK